LKEKFIFQIPVSQLLILRFVAGGDGGDSIGYHKGGGSTPAPLPDLA